MRNLSWVKEIKLELRTHNVLGNFLYFLWHSMCFVIFCANYIPTVEAINIPRRLIRLLGIITFRGNHEHIFRLYHLLLQNSDIHWILNYPRKCFNQLYL